MLFADAHTLRAFGWLRGNPHDLIIADWTAAELYALVNRRVRSSQMAPELAKAGLAEFDAFVSAKARRLALSPSAGALAASLARDPLLKLSAADALHFACAADGGHILVTFDARLADAAPMRDYPVEIP